MPTREIPREDWRPFLDAFSREHRGWLVSIDVLGPEVGAQHEASDIPLEGVAADERDDLISVFAGRDADRHVAHTVPAPIGVAVQQTAEGADEALQIRSRDGDTTILRFRTAIRPELVDGIV